MVHLTEYADLYNQCCNRVIVREKLELRQAELHLKVLGEPVRL